MKHWFVRSVREAGWAPATVVVFYAVAAKGFDAYLKWPDLDMPTHFFGGFAITCFFSTATRNWQVSIGTIPKVARLTMAVGLTAMAAAGWEFLEFCSDRLLGTLMNLGVTDTLSDLFFGILGALIAAVVLARVKTVASDQSLPSTPAGTTSVAAAPAAPPSRAAEL